MLCRFTRGLALAALFAIGVVGGSTLAQPNQKADPPEQKQQKSQKNKNENSAKAQKQQKKDQGQKNRLAYPTGDPSTSVIQIESSAPDQIRVGESYSYELRVQNLTDHLALNHVRVRQYLPQGMEIVESKPSGKSEQQGEARGDTEEASTQAQRSQSASTKKAHAMRGPSTVWTIDHLPPGQTRTIQVTAVGHDIGDRTSCVTVSYEPVLCLQVHVTAPELEITRKVPNAVDVCDPVPVQYHVRNVGKAAAPNVKLREDLPKGLTTDDGKQTVSIDIGELPAGASRDVSAELRASHAGSYSSQAVATSGKQTYRSRKTTTRITQPMLDLSIEGPDTANVSAPFGYSFTVKNNGDGVSRGTTLTVGVDGDRARIVHLKPKAKREGNLVWNLGDIKPNESRKVVMSLQSGPGDVKIAATAKAVCAAGKDAKARATASSQMTTTATAVPALLLTVVDEDPVQVGNETVYTITVLNQGQAPDQNVSVVAKLPEQLEPMKVEGTSDAKFDGHTVTFNPVQTLRPGARAQWKLHVKADAPGDLRTRVELNSKSLQGNPVPSVEPTRAVQ